MVKKLNSMPDFRARMPKQPHDLSRSFAFTSSVGMELPYFQHMCHPHDELFFSTGVFTRINPILLPSLAQVDFHLDYFFVPLTVMYTPSNVLHYGTDDLISSIFTGDGIVGLKDKFPVLDLNETFNTLNTAFPGVEDAPDWHGMNSIITPAGAQTNGFYSAGQAAFRLLDMLGYNPYGIFFTPGQSVAEQVNPSICPWFLAAYQACHQLYFRNDDREKKDYCYNFDQYFNSNVWQYTANDVVDDNTRCYLPLLALRYRSRYKDYFNSVKVSPLSSGTSLREFYDSDNNPVSSAQYLQDVRQFLGDTISANSDQFGGSFNQGDVPLGGGSTNVGYFSSSPLSTASLRAMFALEKLIRVVGRANKDYESQVLAHFGVKVPHDVMHNITHIAHDMFSLRPETVTATATTEGAQLGEVGGQGQVSFAGKKHKFTAPCHGVFMCIISSIPRMRYEAGFDKSLVFNERLDFWQPEFDRLGMQPLYAYEALRGQYNGSGRVGWQFGYEHLKRKYDRVSMAFHETNNNSFSPWVLTQRPFVGMSTPLSTASTAITQLNYANFLVQPRDLDKIMSVKCNWGWSEDFENYPWAMYYTDNFIHDVGVDCKVVNFMSEYGEPELDV